MDKRSSTEHSNAWYQEIISSEIVHVVGIELTTTSIKNDAYLDINNFGDFPELDEQANNTAYNNNSVRFIVQNVEYNNQRLEHVEKDGSY